MPSSPGVSRDEIIASNNEYWVTRWDLLRFRRIYRDLLGPTTIYRGYLEEFLLSTFKLKLKGGKSISEKGEISDLPNSRYYSRLSDFVLSTFPSNNDNNTIPQQ